MLVVILFCFLFFNSEQLAIASRRKLDSSSTQVSASGKSVSSFFPPLTSPPPPATFISIPANISSVSIPKSSESKPTSHKLLIGGAVALAAATLFGALSAFCYYRRKRHLPYRKSSQFTTTLGSVQSSHNDQRGGNHRVTAASSSSSEFLYLGTVVNSRGTAVRSNEVTQRNNKLSSPDLHPLPPLDRFSYKENLRNAVEISDEEEEFYSPRAESPDKHESGLNPEEIPKEINKKNTISPSLSASSSPRSLSLSLSPPFSFSRQSSASYHPPSPSLSRPPLPPPPPLLKHAQPLNSSPSRPPPLVAPSIPFISQNTPKTSPEEATPSGPKLKALHWDKVKANSDREMVWDQLKSSSFKLNEAMMETLFVANSSINVLQKTGVNQESSRVLDPKKAQNIAILLKALNVTIEEVSEALEEGNPDMLGTELLECLLKMAPTREEERRLYEYKDDSPYKLGLAENFLKNILSIPFAFRRAECMLYAANFNSEVDYLKNSFETLKSACEELKNSRMFMKLLEAVLKTGNRMNNGTVRGDAEAFKLDTLLKLVDVKGADGKTTLLHFVVQEIARTERARLSGEDEHTPCNSNEESRKRKAGLQIVSGLSSELVNVKKAASMDSDILSGDLAKLPQGIGMIKDVIRLNDGQMEKFSETMRRFVEMADMDVAKVQVCERVALARVKEVTEYFHGDAVLEEARPFRIFMVVRDFLGVLDRVCKEVGLINARTVVNFGPKFPVPVNPTVVFEH